MGYALLLALALLVSPSLAAEQPAVERPTIAFIFLNTPLSDLEGAAPRFRGAAILRDTLAERGWASGRNVEIIWRSAENEAGRVEGILDELVARRVSVIVVNGNLLIAAAARKTRTIPIVMISSVRPVEAGLVASLSRPGGNVTGLLDDATIDLTEKRIELLRQAVPNMKRVACLHNEGSPPSPAALEAARRMGITLMPYVVDTPAQFQAALADASAKGARGLLAESSVISRSRDPAALHQVIERHRLPAVHGYSTPVLGGGLMFYGQAPGLRYRRAAYYVDRILRGTPPADLPVEQPSAFELIVNRKGARAIGLSLPQALLVQADRVID